MRTQDQDTESLLCECQWEPKTMWGGQEVQHVHDCAQKALPQVWRDAVAASQAPLPREENCIAEGRAGAGGELRACYVELLALAGLRWRQRAVAHGVTLACLAHLPSPATLTMPRQLRVSC